VTRGDGAVSADDGARLWVLEAGHGRPLILSHGGPGLWDMFGPLASLLAGEVRVVRWDQRGCGRSERRGPYSVTRSVADLDTVPIGLGADRIAVLGHSWGTTLALRYALDHPDRVSALIYVSGTGLGWAWPGPFQRAIAERLAPSAARRAELRARDRTEAEDRELAVLQWSAEFTGADAMEHAEEMATPWFGVNWECHRKIWGELDSLERALPRVTRAVLPGVGHVPWLEVPGEFGSLLLDFLRGAAGLARGLGKLVA
jgi:proline iminopeptidase